MATMAFSALLLLSLLLLTQVAEGKTKLVGAGATTQEKYLNGAIIPQLNARYKVAISYNPVGSGAGRTYLIQNKVPFCASDVPFSAREDAEFKGAYKLTLPISLQTISVFVYIPSNYQKLKMNPALLAQIFSRAITRWDHPQILKLNPSLKVPRNQRINVVHRRDSSGSTTLFTQYLSLTAPKYWKLHSGGTITWPAGTIAASGSDGVAAAMRTSPFSIGYLGTSVGYGLSLNELFLPNKAGVYRRAAHSDVYASVPRSLPPTTASWAAVSLLNSRGAQAWPLTSFSYVMVRRNANKWGATGGLLKAFVRYLQSNPAQSILPQYSFFKLPAKVVKQNQKAIATMRLAAGVKAPF